MDDAKRLRVGSESPAMIPFARPEAEAIGAPTLLSTAADALFPLLNTREAAALAGTCTEAADTVAAYPAWSDAETRITGSLTDWRSCVPLARAANIAFRRDLTRDDFELLRGVRELDMRFCDQACIAEPRTFALLSAVEVLVVRRCTQLSDALLVLIEGLVFLDISGCRLTGTTLGHLRNLDTLVARRCHRLTNAALSHLPSLRELDVTGCVQLTDTAFVGLRDLQSLVVRRCHQLTNAALLHLPSLRVLDVSHCPLITDAAFERLRKLRVLDMRGCDQRGITDATSELLDSNAVEQISDDASTASSSFKGGSDEGSGNEGSGDEGSDKGGSDEEYYESLTTSIRHFDADSDAPLYTSGSRTLRIRSLHGNIAKVDAALKRAELPALDAQLYSALALPCLETTADLDDGVIDSAVARLVGVKACNTAKVDAALVRAMLPVLDELDVPQRALLALPRLETFDINDGAIDSAVTRLRRFSSNTAKVDAALVRAMLPVLDVLNVQQRTMLALPRLETVDVSLEVIDSAVTRLRRFSSNTAKVTAALGLAFPENVLGEFGLLQWLRVLAFPSFETADLTDEAVSSAIQRHVDHCARQKQRPCNWAGCDNRAAMACPFGQCGSCCSYCLRHNKALAALRRAA